MHRSMNMGAEEYLDHCRDNNISPRFIGIEPFRELCARGRITPMITSIRVMYSGLIDQCYWLDKEDGMFVSINNPDKPPQKPEDVLQEDEHPDGWEVEMAKPKHLCEQNE